MMGILNVTPDSFSDGGTFYDVNAAVEHGLMMEKEGADLIDVGGESTRPGHLSVDIDTEISRVVPVIEGLSGKLRIPISIDTSKAKVAQAAFEAGAVMLNDVWGLTMDPDMRRTAAASGMACCLMHNQHGTEYNRLIDDIITALSLLARHAVESGIAPEKIILDPGIGFGKTVEQNLEVMRCLSRMRDLKFPWLLGASRKSMIGKSLQLPVDRRLEATIAANVLGIQAGADFIRVHDVKEHTPAVRMTDLILRPPTMRPHIVYVSLGSNLGDKMGHIAGALRMIGSLSDTRIDRVSGVYETSPVGKNDQPAFYNAAAVLETSMEPHGFLEQLLRIEHQLKRVRTEKWGPRTIDIDILFYDQLIYNDPGLIIPHPRLHERRFVLEPLNEIASLYMHPGMNKRIFEILGSGDFDGQRVEKCCKPIPPFRISG